MSMDAASPTASPVAPPAASPAVALAPADDMAVTQAGSPASDIVASPVYFKGDMSGDAASPTDSNAASPAAGLAASPASGLASGPAAAPDDDTVTTQAESASIASTASPTVDVPGSNAASSDMASPDAAPEPDMADFMAYLEQYLRSVQMPTQLAPPVEDTAAGAGGATTAASPTASAAAAAAQTDDTAVTQAGSPASGKAAHPVGFTNVYTVQADAPSPTGGSIAASPAADEAASPATAPGPAADMGEAEAVGPSLHSMSSSKPKPDMTAFLQMLGGLSRQQTPDQAASPAGAAGPAFSPAAALGTADMASAQAESDSVTVAAAPVPNLAAAPSGSNTHLIYQLLQADGYGSAGPATGRDAEESDTANAAGPAPDAAATTSGSNTPLNYQLLQTSGYGSAAPQASVGPGQSVTYSGMTAAGPASSVAGPSPDDVVAGPGPVARSATAPAAAPDADTFQVPKTTPKTFSSCDRVQNSLAI